MKSELLTESHRFLTPAAKAFELRLWGELKNHARPSAEAGGKGFPDQEIIPLVDALNELPGVCTLQSCAGHSNINANGHLWIWLSEERSENFNQWGFVLASMRGIEDVQRKYAEWGQEITVITWPGDDRLKPAINSVYQFFRALT